MNIVMGSTPLIVFLLVKSADPNTPLTGAQPAVMLGVNGAAFTAAGGTVGEIGDGWYKIKLSATETGTAGVLILRASAAGSLEWRDMHQVVLPDEAQPVDVDALTAAVLAKLPPPPPVDVDSIVTQATAAVLEQVNIPKIAASVRKAVMAAVGTPQATIKLPVTFSVE